MNELTVYKDNHLTQKTINNFTHKQNQIMAILLGKYVNFNDAKCIDSSIQVSEIRQVLGLSDGAESYRSIRKAIQKFAENSSVACLEQNKKGQWEYVWRPYFSQIRLNEDECVFTWNDLMKPYLTEMKNCYTQYLASDYLKLKSTHSQNLYEFLKSLENYEEKYNKKPRINVADLKVLFKVQDSEYYNSFMRLNEKLLKKSIKEINCATDLTVTSKTIKKGRTVVAIEFDIKRKGYNYTKKQKQNIPEWYDDTTSTAPDEGLLNEVLAKQSKLKEDVKEEE